MSFSRFNFGILTTLAIIIVVAASFFFRKNDSFKEACFEDTCFTLEIAKTDLEKQKGLMFREKLDPKSGMLFLYERSGTYSFWMKNTLIPLDIIWIDGNNAVVFISHNTPPCQSDPCPIYTPDKEASKILEIAGGEAENSKITPGSLVNFR